MSEPGSGKEELNSVSISFLSVQSFLTPRQLWVNVISIHPVLSDSAGG